MTTIKNPYVLLTGASSGIGRQMAIMLSQDFPIILHGRNEERLLATLNQCSKNFNHQIFNADLSLITELENQLSSFIKENEIDIMGFVHCAGYMKMLPLKMVNPSEMITAFSVNVFSAEIIMKVLTKKLLKSCLFNLK